MSRHILEPRWLVLIHVEGRVFQFTEEEWPGRPQFSTGDWIQVEEQSLRVTEDLGDNTWRVEDHPRGPEIVAALLSRGEWNDRLEAAKRIAKEVAK